MAGFRRIPHVVLIVVFLLLASRTSQALWEYRFNDSTSLFLVCPNSSIGWLPVCSTGFNKIDALVACRSAGLTNTTSADFFELDLASSTTTYFLDFNCRGNETTLEQCNYSSSHLCSHAVGLLCGNVTTYEEYVVPPPSGSLFNSVVIISSCLVGGTLILQVMSGLNLIRGNILAQWEKVCSITTMVVPLIICIRNASPQLYICGTDSSHTMDKMDKIPKGGFESAGTGLLLNCILVPMMIYRNFFTGSGLSRAKALMTNMLMKAPRRFREFMIEHTLATILLIFYPSTAFFSSVPFGEVCLHNPNIVAISYFAIIQISLLFAIVIALAFFPFMALGEILDPDGDAVGNVRRLTINFLRFCAFCILACMLLGPLCFASNIFMSGAHSARSFRDFTFSFSITFVLPSFASLVCQANNSVVAAVLGRLSQVLKKMTRVHFPVSSADSRFQEKLILQNDALRGRSKKKLMTFDDFVLRVIQAKIRIPYFMVFQRPVSLNYSMKTDEVVKMIRQRCEAFLGTSPRGDDDALIRALVCISHQVPDANGITMLDILAGLVPRGDTDDEMEDADGAWALHLRLRSALLSSQATAAVDDTTCYYCLLPTVFVDGSAVDAFSGREVHIRSTLLLHKTPAAALEHAVRPGRGGRPSARRAVPPLSLLLKVIGAPPCLVGDIYCLPAASYCETIDALSVGRIEGHRVNELTVRLCVMRVVAFVALSEGDGNPAVHEMEVSETETFESITRRLQLDSRACTVFVLSFGANHAAESTQRAIDRSSRLDQFRAKTPCPVMDLTIPIRYSWAAEKNMIQRSPFHSSRLLMIKIVISARSFTSMSQLAQPQPTHQADGGGELSDPLLDQLELEVMEDDDDGALMPRLADGGDDLSEQLLDQLELEILENDAL